MVDTSRLSLREFEKVYAKPQLIRAQKQELQWYQSLMEKQIDTHIQRKDMEATQRCFAQAFRRKFSHGQRAAATQPPVIPDFEKRYEAFQRRQKIISSLTVGSPDRLSPNSKSAVAALPRCARAPRHSRQPAPEQPQLHP